MLFKKSLLVLGLAASIGANAAMYQCKKGEVTIPCAATAWDLGGDALYMNFGETTFGNNAIFTAPQSFNYSPSWGFRIEASRHFYTGNDFNANWTYIKSGNQNFVDNANQLYANAVNNQPFTESTYLSMVNLELGQHIDVGDAWDVRVHGGMEITSFSGDVTTTLAGNLVRDTWKSNLVGARAGVNLAYKVWDALSFYTDGALGVLYQSSRLAGPVNGTISSTFFNGATASNMVFNGTAVSTDYSIGLKYAYPVQQGDLITRVGWTGYYFDPANNTGFLQEQGVQGLFFGAKWIGNA